MLRQNKEAYASSMYEDQSVGRVYKLFETIH